MISPNNGLGSVTIPLHTVVASPQVTREGVHNREADVRYGEGARLEPGSLDIAMPKARVATTVIGP